MSEYTNPADAQPTEESLARSGRRNDTPEVEVHAATSKHRGENDAPETEAHGASSKHRGETDAPRLNDPNAVPGTDEPRDGGVETEAHAINSRHRGENTPSANETEAHAARGRY